MTRHRRLAMALGAILVVCLIGGAVLVVRTVAAVDRTHVVAYFDNTNGVFVGDDVRILGVPVGKIETIEPQPQRAKVSFWLDSKYPVPRDAKAVILSPSLVTARAIQLTPAYTGGSTMQDHTVIPQERTAVPMEWDDVRAQLKKLTQTLQPTQPGGVSTLGQFVTTTADNLRGRGADVHDTIVKLSQAMSVLGDHSTDIVSTVKNLSILVSALQSSDELMRTLNQNLAAVTGLLANDPNEIAAAVEDLNKAAADVASFAADNRERLGVTSDKLASISTALTDSIGDVKQTLHVLPNTAANFLNIYQPAQGSLSGALALNNFANPIQFLCGAIQAASRLGAEQAAKLCVQYLAPIVKNRQYNFLPIGLNPIVGASARPNELTYSEDWMRPDYRPTPAAEAPTAPAAPAAVSPADRPPLPAEASAAPATATNPAEGLPGMMLPPGGGS